MILVGLLAFVFGLSALARRFPHVVWLQVIRYDPPQLSEAQRVMIRRRSDLYAGVELMLLGIALPMVYASLTMMFFNELTTTAVTLVLAGSALCIGLVVTATWQSRRG